MSKTNNEPMQPEVQAPEAQTGEGLKLDVNVRPIAPMGNLLAFANVTIGDCFKIDGFRICSGENGLYVNMPSTQDKQGKWRDVCWPVTADFRRQLNDALIDGYGQAIENLQATLEATKGAAEKPSLTGALKEKVGKVKTTPTKSAPAKNEQAR
ncbi:SpoVG family protein [Lachnospiraceae bacterium 62-26]